MTIADVTYRPIGLIRTPHKTREAAPIQPRFADGAEGQIELSPELVEGLSDLNGFSHILLVYHMHLSESYSLKVVPFLDDTPRGLFATRAPRRPNPIGLSVVRLERIDGNIIHVRDIDVVDGTPLLDIKPWVPAFAADRNVRIGWLEGRIKPERGGA